MYVAEYTLLNSNQANDERNKNTKIKTISSPIVIKITTFLVLNWFAFFFTQTYSNQSITYNFIYLCIFF